MNHGIRNNNKYTLRGSFNYSAKHYDFVCVGDTKNDPDWAVLHYNGMPVLRQSKESCGEYTAQRFGQRDEFTKRYELQFFNFANDAWQTWNSTAEAKAILRFSAFDALNIPPSKRQLQL